MSSPLTHFRMPPEMRERMQAVSQGRNLSAMIKEAIILWLAQEEKRMKA